MRKRVKLIRNNNIIYGIQGIGKTYTYYTHKHTKHDSMQCLEPEIFYTSGSRNQRYVGTHTHIYICYANLNLASDEITVMTS